MFFHLCSCIKIVFIAANIQIFPNLPARHRGIGMKSQDLEDLWQKSYSVKGADPEHFVKGKAEELRTVNGIEFRTSENGRIYDSKSYNLGPAATAYLFQQHPWEAEAHTDGLHVSAWQIGRRETEIFTIGD